jgi:prepilin-type processing-associated H-X9-DG protein
MNRKLLAMVVLILLPACCLADSITPPLADRIPADAIVYIGWAGSQSLGPAYNSSHLKAVLDASEMSEFLDTLLPQIIGKIPAREREGREVVRLISAIGGPIWRHPCAVYFGQVDWKAGGPHIALLCDAGAEADAVVGELQKLVARAARGGPPVSVRKYGTLVVVVVGPGNFVDKFANPPAESLANSATFKSALQQVQPDAVTIAYVDTTALLKMVDEAVTQVGDLQAVAIWPKIRDGLGLAGIHQIIATAGFDGQDWMGQAFVGTSATKTGLATLFDSQPLSDDTLTVVPQTASRFAAGHFDMGSAFRGLHSAVEQFDPNVAQQFNQGLAIANAMLGVDIQNDLFDSFGDQWVMYTDRTIGGSGLLGLVVVNKLKNPEKAEAALTSLSQRANMLIAQSMGTDKTVTIEFRQSTIEGVTIHYLAIPLLAPGWGIKDGNLYFGLYPQVVSSAAQFVAAKGPSILQNPAYLALQKRLGDHKPSSVSFLDLPATAGEGYSDLLALTRLYVGFADVFGLQTPAMVLPPLSKIIPHLSPSGGVGWSDEAGWHYRSVEPFPGSEALAGTGSGATIIAPMALITSVMLPSLNRARETANRVKCASNERQIGQAMLMYANENRQKYPPDLGTLVKTEDITPMVFICPDGNAGAPAALTKDQQVDWVNVHSDYVYLGSGFGTNAPASQIMLYEKPGSHSGDGMNLLYGDGHVEWLRMADAMREIDAQQKKVHAGEGGGL